MYIIMNTKFKMLRPVDQQYPIMIWTRDYNSSHLQRRELTFLATK